MHVWREHEQHKYIYITSSGHPFCVNGVFLKKVISNPPTPALAKAGAAPGTTAGVELVFLSNRHPKATSMASYGRPSLPFASP